MNDQRALEDQLDELEHLAAKNGLYDAQDWLRTARARKVEVVPVHEALKRGKETELAFTLIHTVLVDHDGRKTPCTRERAISIFEADKKLRVVKVTQGDRSHYIMRDDTGRTYEMYAQRL
jgi:hypothetical protein